MEVFYGNDDKKINVTDKIPKNEIYYLPNNNNILDKLFGDPIPNRIKSIYINNIEYRMDIYINIIDQKIYTKNNLPNIYPITFSIPEEKIVSFVPYKDKHLSDLIPGKQSTYIYNTEKTYYDEYKRSYFAITMKKAGWDCMRHYEIMANGCIPIFENIKDCPKNTMALLPKHLIVEGNELYKKIKETNETNHIIQKEQCNQLIQKYLKYVREHLTTKKIAEYVLLKTNSQHIKKILFLSGHLFSDYLRCLTLHGFKELIGQNCHDYPKVPHLYKGHDIEESKMWGKGFTYNGLLDNSLHNDELDKTVDDDIKNKKYDIIIYGSMHRGLPLYDLCTKYYNPNEIIILCGEDAHNCCYEQFVLKGNHVFLREMY